MAPDPDPAPMDVAATRPMVVVPDDVPIAAVAIMAAVGRVDVARLDHRDRAVRIVMVNASVVDQTSAQAKPHDEGERAK